jgi:hypothetical protein
MPFTLDRAGDYFKSHRLQALSYFPALELDCMTYTGIACIQASSACNKYKASDSKIYADIVKDQAWAKAERPRTTPTTAAAVQIAISTIIP